MTKIIISDLQKIDSNNSSNVSFLSDLSVSDSKDIKNIKGGWSCKELGCGWWW